MITLLATTCGFTVLVQTTDTLGKYNEKIDSELNTIEYANRYMKQYTFKRNSSK